MRALNYGAYLIAMGAFIIGVLLASIDFDRYSSVLGVSGAFGGAIVIAVIGLIVGVIWGIKNAPRRSPAYLTWPSFASVLVGLIIPIISAIVWLAFTMGSIDAKLDMLMNGS